MKTVLELLMEKRAKRARPVAQEPVEAPSESTGYPVWRADFRVKNKLQTMYLEAQTRGDARVFIEKLHPFNAETFNPRDPKNTSEFPAFESLRLATPAEIATLEP